MLGDVDVKSRFFASGTAMSHTVLDIFYTFSYLTISKYDMHMITQNVIHII